MLWSARPEFEPDRYLRLLGIATLLAILCATVATSAGARITWTGAAGTVNAGVICGDGAVFFSSGTHLGWAPVEGAATDRHYTAAAAASDGFFVIVADDGSVSRSTTSLGSAIIERSIPTKNALRALTEVSSRFVAVGDNGTILRSADLAVGSWVEVTSGTTANLRGVATNATSSTVAVGDDGVILRGGLNGTEWELVNVVETSDFRAVVAAPNGRYLAVGDGGALWTADPNGTAWTRIESGTTVNFRAAAQAGLATVVAGDDQVIRYAASNFTGWIDSPTPEVEGSPDYGIYAAAFTGSDLIAVGSGRVTLWSSFGLQWQTGTVTPISPASWGQIKSRFIDREVPRSR